MRLGNRRFGCMKAMQIYVSVIIYLVKPINGEARHYTKSRPATPSLGSLIKDVPSSTYIAILQTTFSFPQIFLLNCQTNSVFLLPCFLSIFLFIYLPISYILSIFSASRTILLKLFLLLFYSTSHYFLVHIPLHIPQCHLGCCIVDIYLLFVINLTSHVISLVFIMVFTSSPLHSLYIL